MASLVEVNVPVSEAFLQWPLQSVYKLSVYSWQWLETLGKGSRVEGILFNHAIHIIGPCLTVFKRYKISNVEVQLIDEKYRTDGLTTQWVISTKTVMEELPDETDMMRTRFSYTMFKDLAQFMEQKNQFVDILAVVIFVSPVTPFTSKFGTGRVQKFVVIKKEKLPLQLSLFNEFIDNEGRKIAENMNNFLVIVCRRLKVKSFNGIALSTRKNSAILIDPPIQEAMQLKNWCRFDVILYDKNGRVTATLFGDLAEKLVTYFALDAMQYFHKNIELPLMHVHEALWTKEFAIQIQPAASHYGDLQQRYTILHYDESTLAETST
ncbi:uncharacterized protein LOC113783610 isoform X1 [Coffea eugenioides]|uniref:uncharacterized protein LOC113783610 isoform X1 n=1 Tax=Coffea eugenioides TaxID=49369 RepID=UPI000F60EBA4|nr:uncharacterized protein LOC113783610 isoform X1 [Coffea eugenioides]